MATACSISSRARSAADWCSTGAENEPVLSHVPRASASARIAARPMRRLSLALACIIAVTGGFFRASSPVAASAQANRTLLLNPDAPEFQAPAPAVSHVALDTSRGTVLIEVIRDWGPRGADRFYNLARLGY